MRVPICTDSAGRNTGHVGRCLALAEALPVLLAHRERATFSLTEAMPARNLQGACRREAISVTRVRRGS